MQNSMRGQIFSRYSNITEFAKSIGWDRKKASRIINGVQRPTADEMEQMARNLGIEDHSLFISIFFPRLSTK